MMWGEAGKEPREGWLTVNRRRRNTANEHEGRVTIGAGGSSGEPVTVGAGGMRGRWLQRRADGSNGGPVTIGAGGSSGE